MGSAGDVDIGKSLVLAGVLVGAMLPYLFAALTMISVGKAAAEIITEVRHQFQTKTNDYGMTLGQCIKMYTEMYEKHGEGQWKAGEQEEVTPDSDKCGEISTKQSVREMIAPGTYAVLAPLIGGFLVGPAFLLGLLAGAIGSGCMLAIMMANAGGAWDNSKKLCEKLGLKKSTNEKEREQQKACVVGDTVGDPFKDTSGPALNILIKLMSMVSLTVAPLLKSWTESMWYLGLVPLAAFFVLTGCSSLMTFCLGRILWAICWLTRRVGMKSYLIDLNVQKFGRSSTLATLPCKYDTDFMWVATCFVVCVLCSWGSHVAVFGRGAAVYVGVIHTVSVKTEDRMHALGMSCSPRQDIMHAVMAELRDGVRSRCERC